MTKKDKGLNRGLMALLSTEELEAARKTGDESDKEEVLMIGIADIQPNPWQPRRYFDEDELLDLQESITRQGIITPLLVSPHDGAYLLVAGERRLRAAKMAGLTEVPALVKPLTAEEMAQIALVENIQRSQLTPLEEAAGYKRLMEEHQRSAQEVADAVGKSRPYVANLVRLLNLPQEVQELLAAGKLSAGHGKALLGLKDEASMTDLAELVIANGLSVRATEAMVKDVVDFHPLPTKKQGKKASAGMKQAERWSNLAEQLEEQLQTRVKITETGKVGHLTIDFYGEEDLTRIMDLLKLEVY